MGASKVGSWSWDLRTDKIVWDQRMLAITGRDEAVTLEYWMREVIHPEDRPHVDIANLSMPRPGPLTPTTVRIRIPDGSLRTVINFGHIVGDDQGKPIRLVGGLLDITEERRAEEAERAAERMEALGHLTAGVAHNFNNMLMIISPCLQKIQEMAPPNLENDLRDALDAAERATEVVRDLMTFVGQQQPQVRAPRDVASLCEETARLCRRSFPSDMLLHTELLSKAQVDSAPGAIEQVVGNLLVNARDALSMSNTASPCVWISSRDENHFGEDWVAITVSDNGPGVPKEAEARIFEPFMTTKRGKGTGLGLASSQAIVAQHGGQLAHKMREGGGAEFLVLLPAVPERYRAQRPQKSSKPALPQSEAGQEVSLLLVEDEAAIRRILSRGLSRAGFRVLEADSVSTATTFLESPKEVEIVLLDRTLGDGSGSDLVPLIRQTLPQAHVLYLSGEPVGGEELAEVEGFIQKPIRVRDLVAQLRAALA